MPSGEDWRWEARDGSKKALTNLEDESESPAQFPSSAFSSSKATPTVDETQPSGLLSEALDKLLETLQPYLPMHREFGRHVYKGAELIEHGE